MIKINLLAEGKRPAAVRKMKPVLEGKDIGQWLLVAGILAGVIALGTWWWILDSRIEEKEREIQVAEKEVAELAPVIKEVEEYKLKKAELERKITVIGNLKLNQRGPVRVMDDVSRALPELLWIDRMLMTASNIEVEGRAFNTNAVANFIENLDKVPEFEEPTLKTTEEQPGGVYRFVLNFNYSFASLAEPGAAPAPVTGATSG
jgi:type IV pilus assembly protein PilN